MRARACVCVCVCARARARVCVCVCVHKRTTTHQSTFAFLRVGKLNSGELRVRLNLYIRTYIHTYVHGVYKEGERDKLHILTQLIPPIFQHIHVRMCAHTHICTNAHTHVCTNAHTHTNAQTHAHTNALTHTYSCRTQIHTIATTYYTTQILDLRKL